MISRRQARRQALFLLYQWDLAGQPDRLAVRGRDRPVGARARRGGRGARGRARRADHRRLEGWTADRLGVVERSVLRVAIRELDRGEVPAEVAINEAVAFAKRYASDEAAKLVNGILGGIATGGGGER